MDADVVSGLLQPATQGRLLAERTFLLKSVTSKRPATASGCGGAGAVCGVAAPPRCASASPSSRLLASGPAALATPPTPFFSTLLRLSDNRSGACPATNRARRLLFHGWVILVRAAPREAPEHRPHRTDPEVVEALVEARHQGAGDEETAKLTFSQI